MTKQKKGFWLFIFSLIPGAGEMYMGFRKQGISIMLLFWSLLALASGSGMGWLIMFLPIIWFYSFFNVHNLKSLSEEEFYSVEDTYILHLDQFAGDGGALLSKYRKIAAVILIVFGASILWSNFTDILYWILPRRLAEILRHLSYQLPQIVIAAAIIAAGVYIIMDKKQKLEEEKEEEHYWEPYRPYQQPVDPDTASGPKEAFPEEKTEVPQEETAADDQV